MGNSGIYKITSPTGKIYVGQSINIKKRFNVYKSLACSGQNRLYNSFLKHGVDNHVFEILEYCGAAVINERERHYQEKFNVIDRKLGLNCCLTRTDKKKYVFSEESIQKMSAWQKGVPKSKEHKRKLSEAKIGKKQTLEHRLKGAQARVGSKRTKEQRIRISESLKGKNSKVVLDLLTGIYYDSVKELSELIGVHYSTMKAKLNGNMNNNTKYVYT
jgi:group I intron endonuclease